MTEHDANAMGPATTCFAAGLIRINWKNDWCSGAEVDLCFGARLAFHSPERQ